MGESMATKKHPKYIFVVGGVISGVGKGVASSSIAKLLQDRGLSVTAIKIDPYINIDAGTMNPTEHGEVFVLSDGDETDQDMGNYERFLNIDLTRTNYMTTGRVYQTVIERERNLEYHGKCVEVVPHIPLEIIRRIEKARKDARADVVLIEVGGTVGEYQNMLFLEAARMMKVRNPHDIFFIVVSYLPVPSKVGEMKTKPTQNAVRTLNASGIQPDFIIARAESALDAKRKEKLSFATSVPAKQIISAPDVESIYDIPLNFEREHFGDILCALADLKCSKKETPARRNWKKFAAKVHGAKEEVQIAVIGKYFETGDYVLSDSYLSVIEAIKYSAYAEGKKPVLTWLNSAEFETPARLDGRSGGNPKRVEDLKKYDGIIVPGGFGTRGVEGKIRAIEFARKHKIPYFGLCYGMQMLVIEYARNVLHLKDANTREVNPDAKNIIIDIMENQKEILAKKNMGNTMRLGAFPAVLKKGSVAAMAYGKTKITERHRHRYEVNNAYVSALETAGLVFSGRSPDGNLMEIAELPKSVHPFFLGVQFHPEFLARPLAPHPLFTAFIKAATTKKKK